MKPKDLILVGMGLLLLACGFGVWPGDWGSVGMILSGGGLLLLGMAIGSE